MNIPDSVAIWIIVVPPLVLLVLLLIREQRHAKKVEEFWEWYRKRFRIER